MVGEGGGGGSWSLCSDTPESRAIRERKWKKRLPLPLVLYLSEHLSLQALYSANISCWFFGGRDLVLLMKQNIM